MYDKACYDDRIDRRSSAPKTEFEGSNAGMQFISLALAVLVVWERHRRRWGDRILGSVTHITWLFKMLDENHKTVLSRRV